jgi:uncharacterized protein
MCRFPSLLLEDEGLKRLESGRGIGTAIPFPAAGGLLEKTAMNDPYTPPSVSEVAAPPVPTVGISSDERMWAMLGHLSALTGLLTGGIGNIVGPLIVWQVKKDTMPFAAAEAKEALNFNISWLLWTLILGAVTFVLMFVFIGVLLIPVLVILGIAWVVFSVIAGLKANEGKPYRYPLTVRFIP